MKILWLSHLIPYPPKGGVLQRSYHLLKETAKYNEVHLLAFNQKDLIAPLFDDMEKGIKEAHMHLGSFCKSVHFFSIPVDSSPIKKKFTALKSLITKYPYTLNWLLSDEFGVHLKTLVEKEKFDFIHFDTISLAPFKHLCGTIPTSLDHHNIESHMLFRRASKESNWLKKLYFNQEGRRLEKYEKIFCPAFTFNFTCSDVDTKRLLSISPESKAHTVPNGVDINYFDPTPATEKMNGLIFAGTLSWYPNIEAVNFIANEIWPTLKSTIPDITIDIIGANPPKQLVELSKSDPNFRVHGFVDDVRPFFKKAKCYVCPIKDGGGTKLKILDALSMGMAIVADDIACEGIEVTNNHDVIFASSGPEYIAAVARIIKNSDKRSKLETNARMLAVNKYSYSMIGKSLSDLYIQYSKQ